MTPRVTPRRGILLGLGFTLEALRSAGVTDAELDAALQAQVTDGHRDTGICDIELEQTRSMIDVTSCMDDAPVYMPGLQRASVRFKVPRIAVQEWHRAVLSGGHVMFSERMGDVRLICVLAVTEVLECSPVDGAYSCIVRAKVVGAPTIESDRPAVAAAPPQAPRPKDRGRRGMQPGGDKLRLID